MDTFQVKPQWVLNFAKEDLENIEPDWGTHAFDNEVLILRYLFKRCANGIDRKSVV